MRDQSTDQTVSAVVQLLSGSRPIVLDEARCLRTSSVIYVQDMKDHFGNDECMSGF